MILICRILGVLALLVGGFLIFAHFAIIADPLPGVTWGGIRQYIDVLIGVPLLGVGLYCLLRRRSSPVTP